MFQRSLGDDEFGDGVELDHGRCDERFRVIRDAMRRLSER
jgi:hypothetical protein